MRDRAFRSDAMAFGIAVLAAAASACTYPATEVFVALDTDAPRDRQLTLRWHLARGALSIADLATAADAATTRSGAFVFAGAGDAGVSLPASFAVTPNPSRGSGEAVTLWFDGQLATNSPTQPEIHFQRVMRFRFLPRVGATIRAFFPVACGDRAVGCTTVDASRCNVSTRCAEQNATCGDRGECIAIDATPAAPDADVMDVEMSIDASTGRTVCSPTDFPTVLTTGVPAGTPLVPYSGIYSTSHDGEVIDGYDFATRVNVSHANVTIRNSRLHGDVYYALFATGATNLTVEHCEIFSGMLLGDSSHILLRANHFSSEGNLSHPTVAGTDVLFEDNLVDTLTGTPTPAIGLFVFGVANGVVIRHNTIDATTASTLGAVQIASTAGQVPRDVTFECNSFIAPNAMDATMRLGGDGPVVVRSNRFALPANPHGEVTGSPSLPTTWEDNTYSDGTPIAPP